MKLSEAEWSVMEVLWQGETFALKSIATTLNELNGWSKNTVFTYLNRMEAKGLVIKEWSAADVNADVNRIGFAGSPTKVKQIMSVVLAAGDFKSVEATEAGVSNLVHELIEDHTLG